MRKEIEKQIPRMTFLENFHEELKSEKVPYILEVEEIIVALNENEEELL